MKARFEEWFDKWNDPRWSHVERTVQRNIAWAAWKAIHSNMESNKWTKERIEAAASLLGMRYPKTSARATLIEEFVLRPPKKVRLR